MRTNKLAVALLGVLVLANVSWAATSTTEASTAEGQTTSSVAAPSDEGKFIGSVELRPSAKFLGDDALHFENDFEFGYSFSPNFALKYHQSAENNLHNRVRTGQDDIDFHLKDGYFRADFNNIYQSADKRTSFSYNPRAYVPTDAGKRDKGFVTAVRNYLTLSHKTSDVVTLSASLIPILHIYDQAGVGAGTASAAANPFWENRLYLIADFQVTDRLSVSLPLMIHQTRYSDYAQGAAKNDAWDYFAYVWPEVYYTVSDNVKVGAAWYSDNLIASDFGGFTVDDGAEAGVFQLILRASL